MRQQDKLLEAQRIEQRTRYDLEMLREVGYCNGIENYSRPLSQRPAGSTPWTLLDYFPADWLLIIDESHMTLPQVRGMYNGDRSAQRQCWSTMASACPARWTTARCASTSSRSMSTRPSMSAPRPAPMNASMASRWWSR